MLIIYSKYTGLPNKSLSKLDCDVLVNIIHRYILNITIFYTKLILNHYALGQNKCK